MQTVPPACYVHPARPAASPCTSCGGPICGECAVPMPAGAVCKACVARLAQPPHAWAGRPAAMASVPMQAYRPPPQPVPVPQNTARDLKYLAAMAGFWIWLGGLTAGAASSLAFAVALGAVLVLTALALALGSLGGAGRARLAAFARWSLTHWAVTGTVLVLGPLALGAGRLIAAEGARERIASHEEWQQLNAQSDRRARATRAEDERRAAEAAAAESARDAVLARFEAMSPADHLAAARAALAAGQTTEAEHQLLAIASTAREAGQAAQLRRQLDEIRAADVRQRLRDEQAAARANAAATRTLRESAARAMDRDFINGGIEVDSVRATGPDGTTLRIGYALCGRVFVNDLERSQGETLRGAGFRRIECSSALFGASIDL